MTTQTSPTNLPGPFLDYLGSSVGMDRWDEAITSWDRFKRGDRPILPSLATTPADAFSSQPEQWHPIDTDELTAELVTMECEDGVFAIGQRLRFDLWMVNVTLGGITEVFARFPYFGLEPTIHAWEHPTFIASKRFRRALKGGDVPRRSFVLAIPCLGPRGPYYDFVRAFGYNEPGM